VDPLSVKVKEILNFSFPEFPGNEITVKVRPEGRHNYFLLYVHPFFPILLKDSDIRIRTTSNYPLTTL